MTTATPSSTATETARTYFQSVAPYWRDIYEENDLHGAIYRRRRAMVLSLLDRLPLGSGARLLDLGCGAGATAVPAALRSHAVFAVDSVAQMLTLTRRQADAARIADRVHLSRADAAHLPFPSGGFDVVIAVGVLPWLASWDEPLDEMARVLSRSGYLIVSADNRARLNHLLDPLMAPRLAGGALLRRVRLLRSGSPLARRCFRRELDRALARAGLQKLFGATCGFGPFSLFGLRILPDALGLKVDETLQALADRGAPLLRATGSHYVVLARKKSLKGV